jgi:hypothetical protein
MPLSGVLLSAFMLAVFAAMSAIAFTYPAESRLLPLVVGIPGIVLCTGQLLVDLQRYARHRRQSGGELEAGLPPRRQEALLGWFVAFVVGILLLGFPLGGPALVFAFMYWDQGERPIIAGAAALGLMLFLYGVFRRVLGLTLFEGLLLEKLTGD